MRKVFILLIVPVALACNDKATSNVASARLVYLDTLFAKVYFDSPVDYDCLEGVQDVCVSLADSDFMYERTECFYLMDKDTLAITIFRMFKTDSTWRLGTNGYELEKFECWDERVPLKLGLGIGMSVDAFERQFGPFEVMRRNIYSKTFSIYHRKIELMLETKEKGVARIIITAAEEPVMEDMAEFEE